MPQGFQNNFVYGERMRSSGRNSSGTTWDASGLPLIGYDAVFTYRSGKRSKLLSQAGNYTSLVRTGSLADQMRRRNEFLQQQIRDILEPTTGSTSVFSDTDTGHPFATYKISASQPYARYSKWGGTSSRAEVDVTFNPMLPMPNFSDPFGSGYTDKQLRTRFTYFSWPSVGNYISNAPPSLANQIVSNAVKNNIASGLIAGSNPWAPKASLAQTVLELMKGDIPTVLKNLRRYLTDLQSLKRTLGSDWLNIQFGWTPLISDIMDAVGVLLKLHMLVYASEDARRKRGGDLGTWSRFVENPPEGIGGLYYGSPISAVMSAPYSVPDNSSVPLLAPASIPSGNGKWSRSVSIEADYRFSARFHRGARPNSRERGFIEKATELLGLEVTPAVLWELTPWTWLLDWGSNLGSVAANLSQLDWSNVLLDYAYLTFVVKTTGAISWQGNPAIYAGVSLSHDYIAQSYTASEKIREQASPYGFSVSWDGLSPFQLSILAALGMSRGR
jgi:hypothetical protein